MSSTIDTELSASISRACPTIPLIPLAFARLDTKSRRIFGLVGEDQKEFQKIMIEDHSTRIAASSHTGK